MLCLRLCATVLNNCKANLHSFRGVYTLYETEYNVSPFVKLFLKCPFNIDLRPLDVHEYPNSDKVFIKLESDVDNVGAQLHCKQHQDVVQIVGEANNNPIHVQSYGATYKMTIQLPVKADINVETTESGDISLTKFYGDNTNLKTDRGSIQINSLMNKNINVQSGRGDIISNGVLHAQNIILETSYNGSIELSKLQGLRLNIKTQNGSIVTKSSYCNDAQIETINGNVSLDNLHKTSSINIRQKGNLNITGLSGTLNAKIKSGTVDVQISKLELKNDIEIEDDGEIILRLAEDVQNSSKIKISSPIINVSGDIKMITKKGTTNVLLLESNEDIASELNVNCLKSPVTVETSSWAQMLKLKGIVTT